MERRRYYKSCIWVVVFEVIFSLTAVGNENEVVQVQNAPGVQAL